MDNRTILAGVIKEKLEWITSHGKKYYYPNIPTKLNNRFLKYFDGNIDIDTIVAFADTTLLGSSKGGTLFTLYGFYYLDILEKPQYFNYKDISSIIFIPAKNHKPIDAKLQITSDTGEKLIFRSGNYNKLQLRDLLVNLKIVSGDWVDSNYNEKPNGKVEKLNLTKKQLVKCNAIIHSASVAAGGVGAGLAQVPLSDNAIIVPIQITMITSLGIVFEIRVTEGVAKSILASMATSFLGRGISELALGWVPGLGNAINTATAAGITEAAGWLAVKHFFELQNKDKIKYKSEWMKEGYVKASDEYDIKFEKQTEAFIKQGRIYQQEKKEYDSLLDEYDQKINDLQSKFNLSEEENKHLKKMLDSRENLRNIPMSL